MPPCANCSVWGTCPGSWRMTPADVMPGLADVMPGLGTGMDGSTAEWSLVGRGEGCAGGQAGAARGAGGQAGCLAGLWGQSAPAGTLTQPPRPRAGQACPVPPGPVGGVGTEAPALGLACTPTSVHPSVRPTSPQPCGVAQASQCSCVLIPHQSDHI